jgi:toxin ParE1/3/4
MPVITKRPRAATDLAEIWDYIANDSETHADSFIETIDQKLHTIAEQPHIGRPRDELETGVRSFPIGQYIIFYRPIPNGIDIIRVLHGARDLDGTFYQND